MYTIIYKMTSQWNNKYSDFIVSQNATRACTGSRNQSSVFTLAMNNIEHGMINCKLLIVLSYNSMSAEKKAKELNMTATAFL